MTEHTTVSAHHAYEPVRDDELKLEKGDIVIVTDSSDPDWWVGKKDDGSSGFFPSNFVEPVKSSPEEKKDVNNGDDKKEEPESTTAEPTETTEPEPEPVKPIGMARVMEDYAMQGPDELTLHRGGIATLYERFEDGWFKGEINGKVGRFPGECVEEIDMPGRPDLGAQSVGIPKVSTETTEEGATSPTEASKPAFKLAAFGVRQGGIGSVLAGGFPTLKKTGGPKKPSEPEPKPASPPVVEKPTETTPPPKDEEAPAKVEETPTAESELERKPSLPIDKFDQDDQSSATTEKFVAKAIVLHPYDAENEDELNLLRGEYVNVLDKNVDDGWWKGTTERGQTGVFPSNFVKEIEEESIASPPPVRSRKSVTSAGSQQSFNTASSSRVSSGISARAPPLPGNRPSSTASSSRPGSLHEQQPTPTLESPTTSSQPPAIPEEEPSPPAPVVTESPAPVETEEEKTSPIQKEEPKQAEEEVIEKKEEQSSPSPVTTPPVPSRPPNPASRPTSEASSFADKPPLPSSRPTSEASTLEKQPPLPPSRPTSEASSFEKSPPKPASRPTSEVVSSEQSSPKPASRPSSRVESEKADSPLIATEVDAKKEKDHEEPSSTVAATTDEKDEVDKEEEVVVTIEKEDMEEEKPSEEVADETEPEVKSPEEEEEKKTLDLEPTGPKLSGPSRARPTRARRTPQQETRKEEPSQMDLLKKELENEPEEPVKKEEAPAAAARSPPIKPVKPIFAKFPTPFGGAAPELKNLKPVQRRMWEPAPAHESKEPEKKDGEEEERPRPTGVRNIASRFNVPTTGGGSNEVLETKLKNFTKNEVDKLRKELHEEREKRIQLEELVASLAEQVDKLRQQ